MIVTTEIRTRTLVVSTQKTGPVALPPLYNCGQKALRSYGRTHISTLRRNRITLSTAIISLLEYRERVFHIHWLLLTIPRTSCCYWFFLKHYAFFGHFAASLLLLDIPQTHFISDMSQTIFHPVRILGP